MRGAQAIATHGCKSPYHALPEVHIEYEEAMQVHDTDSEYTHSVVESTLPS